MTHMPPRIDVAQATAAPPVPVTLEDTGLGADKIEQLRIVLQESWMIMLPRAMGLWSGPDEHPQWFRSLAQIQPTQRCRRQHQK